MQTPILETLLKLLAEESTQNLHLDALAQRTGYSKYYLCRAFHAATQEPLQTYLRRLRLARAAQLLRQGARVLDVALECGYQSQEAFHRAFVKMFAVTPGSVQRGKHHPSLLLKQPWEAALMPPEALPCRRESRAAFSLYGLGGVYDYGEIAQIVKLWERFHERFPRCSETFGVTMAHATDPNRFQYFACRPAEGRCPAEMREIAVPAQTYQVFRYRGRAHSLLQAFNYIWGVWLPNQADVRVRGVDFEHYPAGYDPESAQAWVDICLPVVARD